MASLVGPSKTSCIELVTLETPNDETERTGIDERDEIRTQLLNDNIEDLVRLERKRMCTPRMY